MANLLKAGARSPRVSNGFAYPSDAYARDEGDAPSMLYRLTIGNRNLTGAAQFKAEEHTVELSEEEMLETIAQWMKSYSHNRAAERKRQKNGHPIT